jgi:hypothetical protein
LVLSGRPPRHNNNLPSLVTTTISPRSQTRGGGGSLLGSLETATMSQPQPPLTRKCEMGVIPCLVLLGWPPRHNNDLPSLVMTTTSPHLQTRGGDHSVLGSLGTAAKSQPRPPLARKHEVGVIPCLIPYHITHGSVQLSCHDHHPLSSSGGCRRGRRGGRMRGTSARQRAKRHVVVWAPVMFFSSLLCIIH